MSMLKSGRRNRYNKHIELLEQRRLLSWAAADVVDVHTLVQDFLSTYIAIQQRNSSNDSSQGDSVEPMTDAQLAMQTTDPTIAQIVTQDPTESQVDDDGGPGVQGDGSGDVVSEVVDSVDVVDATMETTDPLSDVTVEEPVVTDPVVTDPTVTDPVVTDPVVTDPVVTDPVVTDPVITDPIITDPVITNPVVTDPVVIDPVGTDPVVIDPVVTDPVVTDPVVTLPDVELPDVGGDAVTPVDPVGDTVVDDTPPTTDSGTIGGNDLPTDSTDTVDEPTTPVVVPPVSETPVTPSVDQASSNSGSGNGNGNNGNHGDGNNGNHNGNNGNHNDNSSQDNETPTTPTTPVTPVTPSTPETPVVVNPPPAVIPPPVVTPPVVTPPPVTETHTTPAPVANVTPTVTETPSTDRASENHHQSKPTGEPAVVAAALHTPATETAPSSPQTAEQQQAQANAQAVLASAVDATGARTEVPAGGEGEVVQTEDGLKRLKVVWTVLNEQALQISEADPAVGEEAIGMSQPAVAVVEPDVKVDGPLVIQLVQEVDVTPQEAADAAAAQGTARAKQMIEVTYSNAGLGTDVSDAPTANRNFALGLLLGVMTLGVQWYRTSKRKLAAVGRRSVFDPLGAWLDDRNYRD